MALPLPPAFTSLPAFAQNRGTYRYDTSTKSTKTDPSVYCAEDNCGNLVYEKGNISASVNALVDCIPVQVASFSISATVAKGTTAANVEAAIETLAQELAAALVAACP